ncbi:MAG: lysophospholipid acyltransferase family protein [Henriciella sp.]|jgi:lysophospholipid acyltransferase (LPLAT)-like uncharacterized protein
MKSILRSSIVTSILGWIIWLYMALCSRTIRWTVEGEADAYQVWQDNPGVIVAAWHSTILLLPAGWNRIIRKWPHQKSRTAMMISLSKDGEPVAKAIKHLGLEAVRGSSTHKRKKRDKGGVKALAEALRILKSGGAICITPDGPRGPVQIAQNGPVVMSQRTQAPILPYVIVSNPSKRLATWDGFRIPYPFTRGALVFGEAIFPAEDEDRETLRQKLEDSLNAATARAEHIAQKKDRSKRAAK